MMQEEAYRAWVARLRLTVSRMPSSRTVPAGSMDAQEAPETEEEREARLKQDIADALFADPLSVNVDASDKQRAAEEIFNAMRRLDVLEPLLRDPETTEIMVNGPTHVFVERAGKLIETDIRFESRERLEELIHSLVSRVNRTVNESEPIVDARLPDGSRLNAVMSPVALDGPLLTIRRFPETPLKMRDLIARGTLTDEAAGFLGRLVRAGYNLFICGGTGSGKTTFLNVLSDDIPSHERIVTLEDSAELRLSGIHNLARLETRMPNAEGRGAISMQQLIRTSLRMRPDRIIVGEVRGAEAFDMLQAMNTGHDGSMSTGHANSPEDMMRRLETMVAMAAALPLQAIRSQIASAVDIVVFLQRMRDHSRKVVEISEVIGCDETGIRLLPLFLFQEKGDAHAAEAEGVGYGMDTGMDAVKGTLVRTQHSLSRIGKLRLRGMLSQVNLSGREQI